MVVFLCKHFFITQKLLGGYGKKSITSPLLKIIKFDIVEKFPRKYRMIVENFVTKCKAVIGIIILT